MIWLQSAQSSSSFTTRYLNPHSAHTHTKFRKFNHVTSLSRFWESAVHSSGEMRGVEQPSFHLLSGGLISLKVSSAFSFTPTTLFIQMHGQPRCLVVCVREVELITGVIERYTVWWSWWTLTFAGMLAHVCETSAASVRMPP